MLGLLKERKIYDDGMVRVLAPRLKQESAPATGTTSSISGTCKAGRCDLDVPCNERELHPVMTAPVADREATSIPVRTDIWVKAFPQLAPVIRNISAGGRYDAYEATKLSRWSAGCVAIVGDAAHAMAPRLGQGAGLAMTNALALAVALERRVPVEEALQDWEARERPLTEYTQDCSAQIANERRLSRWDSGTLRAANFVPTGTESFGPR